jgi:transcriptional regulator with XRE-family HTH domain
MLSDCLPDTGLTRAEFAARLGVIESRFSRLLREEAPMTPDMAHRLARPRHVARGLDAASGGRRPVGRRAAQRRRVRPHHARGARASRGGLAVDEGRPSLPWGRPFPCPALGVRPEGGTNCFERRNRFEGLRKKIDRARLHCLDDGGDLSLRRCYYNAV